MRDCFRSWRRVRKRGERRQCRCSIGHPSPFGVGVGQHGEIGRLHYQRSLCCQGIRVNSGSRAGSIHLQLAHRSRKIFHSRQLLRDLSLRPRRSPVYSLVQQSTHPQMIARCGTMFRVTWVDCFCPCWDFPGRRNCPPSIVRKAVSHSGRLKVPAGYKHTL
jgi:hypothetical protein